MGSGAVLGGNARMLDTLMSDAQAAQDPVTPLVAKALNNLERVVGQLAR
jgi:hypothetical protein